MVKGFTAKDKVIVHLLDYYDKQDKYPQPAEVTQEGISDCISSKQNTVSYAVRNLVKEGILDERTTRVEGKRQRRKGYFLTDKGFEKARKKKKEMGNARVTLNLDGKDRKVMLSDVNKYLRMNLSMIEILNKVKDGRLEYSIQDKKEDLISYLVDMPQPSNFSSENVKLIERWMNNKENNILILQGDTSVDITNVLSKFIKEMDGKSNLFYFKLDDWHTPRHLLKNLAGFLSKAGEHRLDSHLEASHDIDFIEIFTNFRKDIKSLSHSIMVIEDVPDDEGLLKLLGEISKSISEKPEINLIITTKYGDNFEKEIDVPYGKITLEKWIAPDFYERLSHHFGILDGRIDVIDEILRNRLTSEEYLALSYISIFRKPVEMTQITELDHVNKLTLKNLMQTDLLMQTLDGKPILPVDLRERLLNFMRNSHKRYLHDRAADYYCNIPARTPFESIECAFHAVKSEDVERFINELKVNGEDILKAGFSRSLLDIIEMINLYDYSEENSTVIDYFAGESHRIQGDFERAIKRFQNILDKTDESLMLAKAREGIGYIKAEDGDYKTAVDEYMKATKLLEKTPMENEYILGRIYFKLAHLSNEQGKYSEAKEYLKKSISVLEHENRYSLITSSYFLLARIEKGRGKLEEALNYFKKGVESWKKINESYQRVGRLHDIGSFYKVIRELSNAERFLKETIETCEKFGYRHLKAQALLTLSECHLEKGEYEEAIDTAEQANNIFGSLDKEEEQGYVHALFGQIYLKLNDEEKAEDHLSRAISIYQKLGSSYSLGLAYFSMAKLQERKGNQQGIADNYRKALLSITSSGADKMAKKIKREMKTVPLSM